MPGLLPDDGFIYQRKAVIFLLLQHLRQGDLGDCEIELECVVTTAGSVSFSIDLCIGANSGIKKYYEMKKRQLLHRKSYLKEVIDNFNQIHIQQHGETNEFYLVHACQLTGTYFPKMNSNKNKTTVLKKINPSYSSVFCSKFFQVQLLDSIDENLTLSDMELRSIALIDSMLKEFNIHVHGAAEGVYHSIRSCMENIASLAAQRLKARATSLMSVSYPIKDSVKIDLSRLLDHSNSFFDIICRYPRPQFPDRVGARNAFYSKFSVPQVTLASQIDEHN